MNQSETNDSKALLDLLLLSHNFTKPQKTTWNCWIS